MELTDHDLLTRYAHNANEEAFAELVRRHIDVIYSAARRQVESGALAQDVTQSVFIDLAKVARDFDQRTPVIAWLHLVTRRTAVDVMRRESRLKARERIAAEISTMNESPPDWAQLEPLLDEALETLNDTDRGALLLRYFENKSLREVGEALGISDDAAQKRVSRALLGVRGFFNKRGVAVGAAGLLASLSSHAIQPAPAALMPAISSAVASLISGAAVPQVIIAKAAKTLVVSTLRKAVIATVALAVGVYGAYEISRERNELRVLRQRTAVLSTEAEALRQQWEKAVHRLDEVEKQIGAALEQTPSAQKGDAAIAAEMRAWLIRRDNLRALAKQRSDLAIPELQLLDEETWMSMAHEAQLDTDEHIRTAFAQLRGEALRAFATKASPALKAYIEAHAGMLPSEPRELAPFAKEPLDPAIWERYEMLHTGKYEESVKAPPPFVMAVKHPVDLEKDMIIEISPYGYHVVTF